MSSLTLVVALQVTIMASPSESYKDARAEAEKSGRPLVVMVGAEWCPACMKMEQDVLPDVKERGILSEVEFATVNYDQQRSLARELTGGGSIPQLVMFRRTSDGWMRSRLVGSQSLDGVKKFIDEGVRRNNLETETAVKPQSSGEQRAELAASVDHQHLVAR